MWEESKKDKPKRFGSPRSQCPMIAGRIGGMMREFSWMLLALLVLTGCDDEIIKEEKKPKTVSETESIETEPPLPDKIT